MRICPILLFTAFAVLGCATAEVDDRGEGVYQLTVAGATADNTSHVDQAVARRAGELCPKGWEQVKAWTEPDGRSVFAERHYRFVREIRCR